METSTEIRKISTKTYAFMIAIVLLGIAIFYLAENGKSTKATKILVDLGYKNAQNVEVFSVTQFENIDTKVQGYKYFVKFTDALANKECEGFIIKDFKHNIDKDITCISINRP